MSMTRTSGRSTKKIGGLPDVLQKKSRKANEFFIRSEFKHRVASRRARLIDDYNKLPEFLETLGFKKLHVQLSADFAGKQLLEFHEQRPGEYSEGRADRAFREKSKLMKQRSHSWSSTRRNPRRNAAAFARREGNSAASAGTSILPRLEAGCIAAHYLGNADVQGLEMGRLQAPSANAARAA